MKITGLQTQLETIYRLEPNPPVEQFLVTTEEVKTYLPKEAAAVPQVLLKQEKGVISFAVHVGDDTLSRIEESGPENAELGDFLSAAEEVSHFTYLAWSAHNEKVVSLLDVELQGEIDKYLLARLYFNGNEDLFSSLFEKIQFHPQNQPEILERYLEAHRLAGKFCASLADVGASFQRLREFYRLNTQSRRTLIEQL